MTTLPPTAQALLDAAIEAKDPVRFEVLADYLEERGEPNGWRAVANWMRETFTDGYFAGSPWKWPRTEKDVAWFYFDDFTSYSPNNGVPREFMEERSFVYKAPSVEAALTWLASKFAAADAFATVTKGDNQ